MNIQINQIGYRPNDIKTATFRIEETKTVTDSSSNTDKNRDGFRVVDTINGEIIYVGNLSDESKSEYSGEVNKVADFTSVKKPGKYVIESDAYGKSYEFNIDKNVYEDIFKATMKMFYLQRCGCKVEEKYAGKFAHEACHNTKAKIYGTNEYIDVSGGWHDAGDYGRYIVAASKAVVDLLMAYEYFPEAMSIDYDIPGDNTDVPKILSEVKYELDWMLKMQDRNSGGVYHKVTCKSFCGFVMPEDEKDELVVCPVSDTATADFAATMAYAYRVFSNIPEDIKGSDGYREAADKYLSAAKLAMKFLENDKAGEFINPDGIVTGEYGDSRTIDEYFWAYAEMFKTTGDKKYEKLIKELDFTEMPGEFGWKEVGDYGYYAYITAECEKDEELYKDLYKRFLYEAYEKQGKYNEDAYKSTIYGNYYWGCNMEVANNAIRGIILDRLEGIDTYKDMATAQLHYILGNNPSSKCFVTGFGADAPKNPHHRPSVAMNEAMPGMLVGGPEPLLLDNVAKNNLKGVPKAKCYLDHYDSYSTNEITIYWNSPLVFLLAYMNS